MSDSSKCPVCEQRKPRNKHLCMECREIYGMADDWPEWLKEIVNSTDRWRYAFLQACEYEVPLGDDEYGEVENPVIYETLDKRFSFFGWPLSYSQRRELDEIWKEYFRQGKLQKVREED